MKKIKEICWQKSMAVTVALIFLIVAASFIATRSINRKEEERGFDRLYEEARELAQKIKRNAQKDREQLEMIAAVIGMYEDLTSKDLWKILDSYMLNGMMSRLELLLPDDTILIEGGQKAENQGGLSFEEEAELGAHITDREIDYVEDGDYIVRNCVPVTRDGETIAVLCGIVELEDLPDELALEPYGGEAAVYIIDGNTGDFLLDTWHREPENIWALGEREMAPGYDHEQLKQGLIDGKSGYVVFVSETIGKYLYFYYEPIGINQWQIALSVSEDVVFASANEIRDVLNVFLAFEGTCFVVYFLWMVFYVRNETKEKQHQLDTISYIYDVEKLLFNAHEKKDNIAMALEKIGLITSAERVRFWMFGEFDQHEVFVWEKNRKIPSQDFDKEYAACILEYFKQGNGQLEAYDVENLQRKLPKAKGNSVKNLIAVPVENMDGTICGVLTACNMSNRKAPSALLKSVSFSFSRFYQNMHSYIAIKERGESDILTGLHNRNRYEMDLSKIPECFEDSLACIFVDVNGLHEWNNDKGHEAGDRMLKTVAGQIKEKFGTQYTYRIGGDEFLVFVPDVEEDVVNRLSGEIVEALMEEGIYVSLGIQWKEGTFSTGALIKAAEKKMYAAKKEYYERQENERRARK